MRTKATLAIAGALITTACVGPGGRSVPPPPPGRSIDAVPRPSGTSIPPRPARQPVASTPLSAVPAIAIPGATSAAQAGLTRAADLSTLPVDAAKAASALEAFRISCPSLVRRTDTSGLTIATDWQPACADALRGGAQDAVSFFRRWFEAVQVADGRAFATGYYIPEIKGSRQPRRGYVPIYGRPTDLIEVDLGAFSPTWAGKKIRGRVQGQALQPYFDRTAIEDGALNGRAPVLGYAADAVELFFLQVQGSGFIRLDEGGVLRIGYDTQNGRDYTGIGALMKSRGLLGPGQSTMQGIVAWLHAHPDEGRAIMRENRSYVFFRELSGAPQGALGLPVSGGATVAADPKFVPLGAPVFLSMDRGDANGIWIAQDTGGAIKGSNRFDTFWGAGEEARAIAGGMSARGTAFVLLPRGSYERWRAGQASVGSTPRP